MRTVQLELLRPEEVREEQARVSLCYLPVGPVEWHSYHMPLGTDGLAAQALARATAAITGGLVAPTLFIGAERHDSEAMLRNLCVAHEEDSYIWGMDFPKNVLPSMYLREEVFATIIREELRLLVKLGFRMVVVVNGHGATAQIESVRRVCDEMTHESAALCLPLESDTPRTDALFAAERADPGHADRLETALMLHLTDSVDMSRLPPRETPLHSGDFGIASGCQFAGHGAEDGTVSDDPRDATADFGRRILEAEAQDSAAFVLATYQALR